MLREDTLYLKLATTHDLVHDASHVMLLDLLHDWNRGPFESFQDLALRGRPKQVTAELLMEKLHAHVGSVHQPTRFKFWRASGSPVRAFEFHAGAHPYTGIFHTQIDLRVEKSWVARNPDTAPRVLRRRFIEIARLIHPFQGHVHDTDDNSTQNIDNPGLLRRGFGIETEGPIALEDNPGRELSRGQFRYCVNWLTLFGPELLGNIAPDLVAASPAASVEPLDIDPGARKRPAELVAERMGDEPAEALRTAPQQWLLLCLGGSPLDAEAQRHTQRAVREHLGFKALAKDQRTMLGYWQKKM